MRIACLSVLVVLFSSFLAPVLADAPDDRVQRLERTVLELQRALASVQEELRALKAPPPSPAPPPPNAAGGLPEGLEVGIVGDFTAAVSRKGANGQRPADRASLREAELLLGGELLPEVRAHLVLGFPDGETPEVEEGYADGRGVPGLSRLRIGRMRSPFGRANPVPRHDLPQADYPRVLTRMFGDEGLSDTGAALTWEVPGGLGEATYMLGNGENASAFDGRNRSEPLHVLRWEGAPASSGPSGSDGWAFGASGAYGAQDRKENNTARYLGADLAYTRCLPGGRALRVQGEAVWARRQRTSADPDVPDLNRHDTDERKSGGYAFAELQWSPRWSSGVRGDWVEIPGGGVRDQEWAAVPYVTFRHGERLRLRLQWEHRERRGGADAGGFFRGNDVDTLTLQGTVFFGSHRGHEEHEAHRHGR